MNFKDALAQTLAELTPQPWDYTTPDGTPLTVIPAGLREDLGAAEVYIRLTASKTLAVQAAVNTTDLPALIAALGEPVTEAWELTAHWPDGTPKGLLDGGVALAPVDGGLSLIVTEETSEGEVSAAVRLPEAQRMPLASALGRALDVARAWEDEA